MFVSVIVTAAGKGSRMQSDVPKQYLKIGTKPILAHTLTVFEKCLYVNEIIVVTSEAQYQTCLNEVIAPFDFTKISNIVIGGNTRQESVYHGLSALHPDAEIVLVHDGVRPFITDSLIAQCIDWTRHNTGCILAVPVTDTIKSSHEIDDNKFVSQTLPRHTLWSVQTPQAFQVPLLRKAYEKAMEEGFDATDDSLLVERLNEEIKIIEGSYDNIKITTKEDFVFAEQLLRKRGEIR